MKGDLKARHQMNGFQRWYQCSMSLGSQLTGFCKQGLFVLVVDIFSCDLGVQLMVDVSNMPQALR